jgi:hypothetical protein
LSWPQGHMEFFQPQPEGKGVGQQLVHLAPDLALAVPAAARCHAPPPDAAK